MKSKLDLVGDSEEEKKREREKERRKKGRGREINRAGGGPKLIY